MNEELLRDYIRGTLTEQLKKKLPKAEKGFVENMAVITMKWAHRSKLLDAYDRWQPFVERAGAGNGDKEERMEVFYDLRDQIQEPFEYIKNAENGSEYWTGLAALVPRENQGEVMGERLRFRQDLVDGVLQKIEGWIKEAVEIAWAKVSESPVKSAEVVYKVWSALPDTKSEAMSESSVPSKAVIVGAFVEFSLLALGKKMLGVAGPLAALSALLTMKDYFDYKSSLVDMADKITGDSSLTLKHEFLPSSIKDKRFLKSAEGLAAGVEGDWQAGFAAMKKAMGR